MVRPSPAFLAIPIIAFSSCDGSREDSGASPAPIRSDLRLFWDLHDRAKDLYAAGELAGARDAYRAALEKDPSHPASLYNLAHIDLLLRRHREALELLDRLRAAAPAETKANLLAALVRSDPFPGAPFDLAGAAAAAERALSMNSEDSGPALIQGRIALLAGDLARARERLSISARANPKNAEALSLLGVLALREGRAPEAADLFTRAGKAAEGAPPPAGVSGEGDTAKARAGERRDRLFQARWLLEFAGGETSAGAAGTCRSLPALLPAELLGIPAPAGPPRSGAALAAARLSGGQFPEVAVGSRDGPLEIYRIEDQALREVARIDVLGISALAALDLDGDRDGDLYAILEEGDREVPPAILINLGGLRFDVRPAPGGPRRALAAIPVSTDGGGQAVVEVGPPSKDLGPIRLIRRGGDGGLEVLDILEPGSRNGVAVAAASLGAGPADVAVAFADRSPVVLRWREGRLRPLAPTGLEDAGPARALAALDADGDGSLDLVLAEPAPSPEAQLFFLEGRAETPSLRLFLRRPEGQFQESPGLPRLAAGITALVTGDVDGDGAEDLVAMCGGPEPWRLEPWWILLREGKGFRAFRGPALPSPSFKASAAVLADLDGDGAKDLILAGGGLLPGDPGAALLLRGRKAGAAPPPR